MVNHIGKKIWAIPEGYIPAYSHTHGQERDLTSHEAICILNASSREAHILIIVYFADQDPVGPYRFMIPPQRTRHVRLNDFKNPAIPAAKEFSTVIESDVEIVVQHTRLDSRQPENALMTTIAFAQ